MNGQNPRHLAFQVLQPRREADFVQQLLEKVLADSRLPAVDRHLCQELVYGVTRWEATLDFLIHRKAPGRTQKPGLNTILRLGLYQLFWLDRIPPHAAVNESVRLARETGFGPQAGFVNAVLRAYTREQPQTRALLAQLRLDDLAIGYSHPAWLVERWKNRWDPEPTRRLLEWNNTPPQIYARLNSLKTSPEELLPIWRDEHVEYDFVRKDWIPENTVFELKAHPPLHTLPTFLKGFFYIQDPSTLLAPRVLNPEPGERILDLCAAPGGKLTYIAQLCQNQGLVIAHDPSSERLALVRENCQRLGVKNVELAPPGARLDQIAGGRFDRILLDVPCSNTGVLRRRVDLRWRIQLPEVERLAHQQLGLLKQAADLLVPGGTLVYSTCSLEPEENEALINRFLQENSGLQLQDQRQLLPMQEEVDGAYVARLRKA